MRSIRDVAVAVAALLPMLAAASCSAPVTPRAAGVPRRIVSINPCVDAILVQVADPVQIAGISHYSQDPAATSISVATARRFTATSGTAEEVVALSPDLVIAGAHVDPATVATLARLRIPLLQLGVAATIAESRDDIDRIAAAVGHKERGERLNARIGAAVAAARNVAGPPVPALIWLGGGLVPGTGTLASEMMGVAGYRNLSAAYGLKQWDVLPLEYLVAQPPRVLFTTIGAASDDRMLSHPVLRPLARRIAVHAFPRRLVNCGGPTIIDALGVLAEARRQS